MDFSLNIWEIPKILEFFGMGMKVHGNGNSHDWYISGLKHKYQENTLQPQLSPCFRDLNNSKNIGSSVRVNSIEIPIVFCAILSAGPVRDWYPMKFQLSCPSIMPIFHRQNLSHICYNEITQKYKIKMFFPVKPRPGFHKNSISKPRYFKLGTISVMGLGYFNQVPVEKTRNLSQNRSQVSQISSKQRFFFA